MRSRPFCSTTRPWSTCCLGTSAPKLPTPSSVDPPMRGQKKRPLSPLGQCYSRSVGDRVPASVFRFYFFEVWAAMYPENSQIFIADFRDVLFQADPFSFHPEQWLLDHQMAVFKVSSRGLIHHSPLTSPFLFVFLLSKGVPPEHADPPLPLQSTGDGGVLWRGDPSDARGRGHRLLGSHYRNPRRHYRVE